MKNIQLLILSVVVLALCSCTETTSQVDVEKSKQEIRDAEKAFAAMVADQGMAEGFLHFAADDAILLRGKRLIGGKDAMRTYFGNSTLHDVELNWEPSFVDVAASGDLGYTYGPYTFSAKDTLGNQINDSGYFHTVWKKQANSVWRFVWD